MFQFLKSLSRSVHQEQPEPVFKLTDDDNDDSECTSLTVWRKSLVISCNGFTVIDSGGNLAYRVDNYTGRPHELVLMDGSGKSIFTMRRRKKLMVVNSWNVYKGEEDDYSRRNELLSKMPICCVKKEMMGGISNDVLAYVYYGASNNKRHAYTVEGSYANRSCKVFDGSRRVVAEIKRKEAAMGGGVSLFGVEVFLLIVQPGFDPSFAMGLVLLLDQMFS